MGKKLSIEAATKSNAADLAILDNIASHGLSQWLWQGAVNMGKADDALDWGRQRMGDENLIWGYKNCRVAHRDNWVVGATRNLIMDKSLQSPKDEIAAFVPISKLLQQCNGHMILDCLAVYPFARGLGVGKALLDDSIALAKSKGVEHYSLVAEEGNNPALELYRSRGLREVSKQKFVPFKQGDHPENWLLLSMKIKPD